MFSAILLLRYQTVILLSTVSSTLVSGILGFWRIFWKCYARPMKSYRALVESNRWHWLHCTFPFRPRICALRISERRWCARRVSAPMLRAPVARRSATRRPARQAAESAGRISRKPGGVAKLDCEKRLVVQEIGFYSRGTSHPVQNTKKNHRRSFVLPSR